MQALADADSKRRLLVIDQFEEIFVRGSQDKQEHFIAAVAQLAAKRPAGLAIIIVLRSDYIDQFVQSSALGAIVGSNLITVGPLSREEMRLAIEGPARRAGLTLEPGLSDLIVNDAADAPGALPLLQYVLSRLWEQRRSGYLTVEAYREMGGALNALAHEAEVFVSNHPNSVTALRRIFTLKLARLREDGEPTRRLASLAEFSADERALVDELVSHRLLITSTSESGEPYVEVAHEAIFRSWDRLQQWLAAERDFLVWRSRLDVAYRAWAAAPAASRDTALLMGFALAQARHYLREREQDLPPEALQFIQSSVAADGRRRRRLSAVVGVLAVVILGGALGWFNQTVIVQEWRFFTVVRPYIQTQIQAYVLTTAAEQALRPGQTFRECAKDCPNMVVIPVGSFIMGSPDADKDALTNESPQHKVTIVRSLSISESEVTFDDWDACVANGDCPPATNDGGFGRGTRPVINVSWDDAKQYVAWLSRITGKAYRKLSEAEYEYAARAGTATAYFWGDAIGKGNANCNGCGSQWDNKQTAPVRSFAPNAFGLFDIAGNVWEWVEDCQHDNYDGAPSDGSAWVSGDCNSRMIRGGSWASPPSDLRSARRNQFSVVGRNSNLGFRIARTLRQ